MTIYNLKYREVWCPNCKTIKVTNEPAPVCEECYGKPMITVIRSLTSGERITGTTDELGSRSS